MKRSTARLRLTSEHVRILSGADLATPRGGDIGWSEYGGGGCGYTRTDDTGGCCVERETRGTDCQWSLRVGICPM